MNTLFVMALVMGAVLVGAVTFNAQAPAEAIQRIQKFEEPKTITVTGTATINVVPDKAQVNIGIESHGGTAQEAYELNEEQTAQVIAALQNVTVVEIKSSGFYIYPVYTQVHPLTSDTCLEGSEDCGGLPYESGMTMCIAIYPVPPECQPHNVITGYTATNNIVVTVEVNSDNLAGVVIDKAVEAGATNVNGVTFFVSEENQEKLRDNLLAEASKNAKHKAEIVAEALGVEITGVQSANIYDTSFPVFYREAYADKGIVLPPGEQTINSNVSVAFTLN
jgi:uncharacterized protein